MTITHAAVKASGDIGTAAEWNDDHVVSSDQLPKHSVTFIVAASDSNDTGRADYVCDGTADEVQINQAINALPATGGSVVLLEGYFNCNAEIIISKSNVSLIGQGKGTRITGKDEEEIVNVDTKSGVLISKIYFDGTGTDVRGVYFGTCTDSIIERCWFKNSLEDAIEVWRGSKNRVINNYVEDGSPGIDIFDSDENIVANNIVSLADTQGIYVGGASLKNVILGNVVSGCASHGIVVLSNSDRNIVASNQARDNTGDGIRIHDATCDRCLVHGNIAVGNAGAQITDNGTNTTLADNIVL